MKKTLFFLSVSFFLCLSFAHSQWATNGNNIYNTNSGSVGIGISNPAYSLEVNGGVYTYDGLISNTKTVGGISGHFRGPSNGNGNVVIQGGAGTDYDAWWLTGSQRMFRIGANGSTEPSLGAINIDYAGRVGIGRDPEFNFDAVGIGRFGAATNTNANVIIQGGAGNYNAFWLTGTGNTLRIGGVGGTEPSLGAINIDYLGNVGIGRNPEFMLDVNSTGRFSAPSNTNANVIIQGGAGNYNAFWLTGTSSTLKIGGAGGTEPSIGAINIDYLGNVSIGTTNNYGYKLAVNGNAIFTEAKVKLYSNWPDYVFHKNYNLMPLDKLEEFIRQNNHLPDLLSAKEVKENDGIELGNMSAKLLEKIEELTLYIIELKKENTEIKKQFKNLQKEE